MSVRCVQGLFIVQTIDKKITQADVRLFFESFCGEVHRLRLLGDYHHSTRIAFVEFAVVTNAGLGAIKGLGLVGIKEVRVGKYMAVDVADIAFFGCETTGSSTCLPGGKAVPFPHSASSLGLILYSPTKNLVYRIIPFAKMLEYSHAESAIAALNCSGAVLGSLPIRVSPSKTPVRPRLPRPPFN
ncbi:hypothetical protein NC652_028937 [Populus alba x Populus x berolinensis]|nr:hypothetical protein NC652_028937 [Populus alba x Populus x berolinensis]